MRFLRRANPFASGPLGQLTRALETRRRVARFAVIFSVAMLAFGWLPLLVISGMARHLVPLGRVLDYLPDAVLIISAGLGIGGGVVWAITDRKCVQLPSRIPSSLIDARREVSAPRADKRDETEGVGSDRG